MECSTSDFSILLYLKQFVQIHVHSASDTIQPSHPLRPPSLSAFNSSQCKGHFQRVSSSHQVAKVWSFGLTISSSKEYSGFISLRLTGLISVLSKRLPRVFSNTTIQRHQFFRAQPCLWSNSHIHI